MQYTWPLNRTLASSSNQNQKDLTAISAVSVVVYDSIQEIGATWQSVAPKDNLVLQKNYLTVLEAAPPINMSFTYFVFYKHQKPIGIAACQIQNFKANQSINIEDENKTPCFFSTIARYLKGLVASKVEFNTLVCGSLLITGEHGFYFKKNCGVSPAKQAELILEALHYGQKVLEKKGIRVSVSLIKDYFEKSRIHAKPLVKKGFNEFTIQPNMIMDLREEWQTFEDYKAALSSKYRVRTKRAFKKAAAIEKRELDLDFIEKNQEEIHQLYGNVAKNVGFNVVNLNKHYLYELKKKFPDRFKVMGYFYEDKMIAFFSTFLNKTELEAHYLGLDKSTNHQFQTYLNILYDIIKIGIDSQSKRINFARTALEIKSSVGAEAYEMYCYMRHRNSFSNRFFKPVLDYLRPKEQWKPRQPFKSLKEVPSA